MPAGASVSGGALEARDSNRDKQRTRMPMAKLVGEGHTCVALSKDTVASAIGTKQASRSAAGAGTSLMHMLCGHHADNTKASNGTESDDRRKRQRLGF